MAECDWCERFRSARSVAERQASAEREAQRCPDNVRSVCSIAAAPRLLCAATINQRPAHALCGAERTPGVRRRLYVLICRWCVQEQRGSSLKVLVSFH
jgi:hypothetical protein